MPAKLDPAPLVRAVASVLLAFSAVGCTALMPVPSSSPPPIPEIVHNELRHEVYFGTDLAEPSASELARLDAFLASLPADGTPRLRLIGRADERASGTYNLNLSAKRAESVGRHIVSRLGSRTSVATSALGEGAPIASGTGTEAWSRNRSVAIVASSYLFRLPECADWRRDPAIDSRNLPLGNLGCANAVNLGLMVNDPADLAVGRAIGPADGVREAEAVVRYRTDKVKGLDKQLVTK